MCSFLVNSKLFSANTVPMCCASVSLTNKNQPSYHVTLLILSEQIKIYRALHVAETAYYWVNTRRNDYWCTCFSSEGTGAELTLPLGSSMAFLYTGTILKDTVTSVCHVWAWGIPHGLPGTLWGVGLPAGCAGHVFPDLWYPQTPNSNRHSCSGNRLEPPTACQPSDVSALTSALIRSLLTALELWGHANRCNVWELEAFQLILNTEQLFHVTSLSGWDEKSVAPFLIDREKIKGSSLLNNL